MARDRSGLLHFVRDDVGGHAGGRPVGEIASIWGDRMALFSDQHHCRGYCEDSAFTIIMPWSGQVKGHYSHVPYRVCYD